mgnify:CR=1 FL=1
MNIKTTDENNQHKIDSTNYEKKHSDFLSLEKEVNSTLSKFKTKGFIDTQITNTIKKNDTLYIYVIKLNKYIDSIEIKIDPEISKKTKLKKTNKNTITIPYIEIEGFLEIINNELANNGNPFNSIYLTNIKRKENRLFADLKTNITKKRFLDKIITKGYTDFPKSYLKNFLKLKTEKIFNKEDIDKKIKSLSELDFARSIRDPEVLFTKDSTTLYLYLEKQNSNSFDGFLGFSNSKDSKNISLNGYLNLTLKNNLNYGESLQIEYKNSGEEYTLFKAQATIPFIFNTPINIESSLSLTKQDSTFTKNEQIAGISFWATNKIKTNINYQSETSNYLLDQNTTTITNYEDYTKNSISLILNYTKLSQIPIFENQTYIKTSFSLSKRETNLENTNQQELSLNFEKLFNLNSRNHIYLANQSKIILSQNYLDNELYWIGGINSIRGFEENSLTTNKYTIFNTEYRYILDNNLYANTVFDFGKIENKNQNQKNNVYAIGFGLGLKTKNGLLKLIFANGKTTSQNFNFDNTKVHISLTTIF